MLIRAPMNNSQADLGYPYKIYSNNNNNNNNDCTALTCLSGRIWDLGQSCF